ncbi:Dimodular nonribosomal peptide synthase [Planctomycetes bacterium CA13]|uniref:Dimodular nonribosomal peptide synthase n=1 Tax=Novipirellula herctigrandis TaxID=2527986 RepID=A0A5C5ZBS9_9BACT|nr:Dimodular nonribosomal peptide synthase [Planctomycetes bacterium CA13]
MTDSISELTPEQKRELLKRLLQEKANSQRQFPMSSQQQGLWHAFRRDPESTAYNVFLASRVRSELDLDALAETMRVLSMRHHALRTTFSDSNGTLQQSVHESLNPEIEIETVEGFSDAELRCRVLEHVGRPFDLEAGPLLRLVVLRVSDDDMVVVATTHHIVTDFWSLVLIMRELREIYPSVRAERTLNLSEPANHFANYVRQQAEFVTSDQKNASKAYWQQQVTGVASTLELPLDYRRPAHFTGRAHSIPISLSLPLSNRIRQFAQRSSVTTNAVLLSAVEVLLSRYSRQPRFLIGIPSSGRSGQQFENTVGYFSGVLPIRVDVSGGVSFESLVRQTSATMLAGLDHERYPFAEIVKDANPLRDASRAPLIQSLCTFENSHLQSETDHASFLMPTRTRKSEVGGMIQESFAIPHPTCHYDIEFAFDSSSTAIGGIVCFCADLFRTSSMQQFVENFRRLTNALIDQSTCSISSLKWGEAPPVASMDCPATGNLNDLLAEGADTATLAGGHDGLSFSPQQIERCTSRLAKRLVDVGVKSNELVAVILPNRPACAIAVQAVLRSGAALIPIDADQPSLPLQQLLAEAEPVVVITDRELELSAIPSINIDDFLTGCDTDTATQSSMDSLASVGPDELAYVIFTSGSTGRPKGVMINQGAIANTIQWRKQDVKLTAKDRVIALLSHQFDAGLGVMLTAISQGATLVWPKQSSPFQLDLDDIIDTLIGQRITVLVANPSLLQVILAHPRFDQCCWLEQIWTGGETMPTDLPNQVRERTNARLWNFYGPTEASIEATAYETPLDHDPSRPVPIGRAIANTQIAILDDHFQPVADGVPGQIAILGNGLARGYLSQPTETAKSFRLLESFGGKRAYLTGDLGRINADGLVEFLGRIDGQVKLRGYRIELEEIEQHLRNQPSVLDAAVCVLGEGTSALLVGLMVTPSAVSNLEDGFSGLPRYKRPARVHRVDAIPKNASGKIDRSQLKELAATFRAVTPAPTGITVPQNDFEAFLATTWCEVLQTDSVQFDESFFDAGGSSLQAAMLTAKLTDSLGVRVPVALLFDLSDIRTLARRLAELYPTQIEASFGVASVQTGTRCVSKKGSHPLIAAWQPSGDRPPIFMVHPPGGIVVCYRDLAQQLSTKQPLYAIRSKGLHGDEALPETMQAMAAEYVAAIEATCPDGPIVIGGWSLGGLAAVEVAKQLLASRREVQHLILLDTSIPAGANDRVDEEEHQQVGLEYGIDLSLEQLGELAPEEQLPFLWEHAKKLGVLDDDVPAEVVRHTLLDLQRLFHHHVELANRYQLDEVAIPIVLFRPLDVPVQSSGSHDRGWSKLAKKVTVIDVPGHHHSMLSMPHVVELARYFNR